MIRSGTADLPLHYGRVPPWLYRRMERLGAAIATTIVHEYGRGELLRRLSDPFFFQSFGALLGMDWHSSGITTSLIGSLKKGLAPRAKELGIYICGGKGNGARNTPDELLAVAERTGLDGDRLVQASRLSAKVDNTAIQDGFSLYLHSFFVTENGEWAVIQQGMNDATGFARRYHWHSPMLRSFTETPHTFIYGKNQGAILNLTDRDAVSIKQAMISLSHESPVRIVNEIRRLRMPDRHFVVETDVNLKRLGAVLARAYDRGCDDFETLLLTDGLGPRTIQSLAQVAEVIHGTPSRFADPARFSLAHGGKDGHPFPVPTRIYDEVIDVMDGIVRRCELERSEKTGALKRLHESVLRIESNREPLADFKKFIQKEKDDSARNGGRTVFDDHVGKRRRHPRKPDDSTQLTLF